MSIIPSDKEMMMRRIQNIIYKQASAVYIHITYVYSTLRGLLGSVTGSTFGAAVGLAAFAIAASVRGALSHVAWSTLGAGDARFILFILCCVCCAVFLRIV